MVEPKISIAIYNNAIYNNAIYNNAIYDNAIYVNAIYSTNQQFMAHTTSLHY